MVARPLIGAVVLWVAVMFWVVAGLVQVFWVVARSLIGRCYGVMGGCFYVLGGF